MWEDLDRPPLRSAALRRALVVPQGPWAALEVLAQTGSTNADLLAAARAGAPDRTVLIAERQDAGRGRLSRQWTSPPRSGLTMSVLLRPTAVPLARWGWLPLLVGVSLVTVLRQLAGLDAVLKWPNDVLVGPRRGKAAGILVEVAAGAVVLGIGCNVTSTVTELPAGGTSLALEGAACTDRDPLLRALLRRLAEDERRWRAAGGDPERCGLRDDYLLHCVTLGEQVQVELPGGVRCRGTAVDVDLDGRLVLAEADTGDGAGDGAGDGTGTRRVAAGDVLHLRPVP